MVHLLLCVTILFVRYTYLVVFSVNEPIQFKLSAHLSLLVETKFTVSLALELPLGLHAAQDQRLLTFLVRWSDAMDFESRLSGGKRPLEWDGHGFAEDCTQCG